MENHNKKTITPEMIKYEWKKIDRKLKNVTTDSEISGVSNPDLQNPINLPLAIQEPSKEKNLLGGMSVSEFIYHLNESWEKDSFDKNKRYIRYSKASDHPEMDGALNIYADETFSEDQHGNAIHIKHPDQDVVEIVEELYERIGLYDKGWEIVRNMCCFGDEYYEIIVAQSADRILKINWIPREFIKRVEKDGVLEGFEIDKDALSESNESSVLSKTYGISFKTPDEQKDKLVHPFRILHFKIPSRKYGVYGKSILDSIISSIESLQMMERAMMVNRITRAAERRVYNVDVGQLQGDKAIEYAEKAIRSLNKKRRMDYTNISQMDFQKDVFGASEDIIIPKRSGVEGNSIDTLPAANNLSDVGDLEYLRDKIFPGLGIPRQYLFDDQFTNANLNLSSKSTPFAKKIKRIQRFFLYQLYKLTTIELKLRGYSNKDIQALELFMTNPSNIDEKDRLEIETNKWTLITTIKGINTDPLNPFYPDYLLYRDYLKLNDDEILELLKLNRLQSASVNPFQAFDPKERPEGSDVLDSPKAAPAAGTEPTIGPEGGMPGEVTSALGTPPPEAGTAPEATPGAENATTPPAEVPEVAEFEPEVFDNIFNENKLDKLKIKKNRFLNLVQLKEGLEIEEAIKEKLNKKIQEEIEKRKYIKNNIVLEEMTISGELKGLDKIENKNLYIGEDNE